MLLPVPFQDQGILQHPDHLNTFDTKQKRPMDNVRSNISVPLPFLNVDSGVAYKQRLLPLPVHNQHIFQPQHVNYLERKKKYSHKVSVEKVQMLRYHGAPEPKYGD